MSFQAIEEQGFVKLPDRAFIKSRLAKALEFAHKAVQHLIIDEKSAPEDAPWFVRSEKIIGETALLMVFSKELKDDPEIAAPFKELSKILAPLARSQSNLLNICLKPALGLDYAHAHICLSYAGFRDSGFDALLTNLLKSEAFNGIERTPYRMLERAWLLQMAGIEEGDRLMDRWLPHCCLQHLPDLFLENNDTAYALTHAVMYSSFPSCPKDRFNKTQVVEIIEALLVRYMDEQDYDISGELLTALALLNVPFSPSAQFALYCLFEIERKVGFLPAPGLDLQHIEGKELDARRTYIYSINYHTVLVMGLLCSALLRQNCSVDVINAATTHAPSFDSANLPYDRNEKPVHWLEFFNQAEPETKKRLGVWDLQVFIYRALKKKDYSTLNLFLGSLANEELLQLPVVRQAKALLERLRTYC